MDVIERLLDERYSGELMDEVQLSCDGMQQGGDWASPVRSHPPQVH